MYVHMYIVTYVADRRLIDTITHYLVASHPDWRILISRVWFEIDNSVLCNVQEKTRWYYTPSYSETSPDGHLPIFYFEGDGDTFAVF